MTTTHHTFCRICEALCGLEVDVEQGRVVDIRPDRSHVGTAGFSCPKGTRQARLYDSPDRLRHPLKRIGDRFERVSWAQALAEIGAGVARLRRDHHPDSVAMYVGTAAGFSLLHPAFAQGFMTGVGSRSMYSSATQDCANKFAVSRQLYGYPFTLPFPDVDRTSCLILVGANPAVSKWSFLQVADPVDRLREIERRGGTVFVVDPRRTETARAAGEHVFIRPSTDVFFYASFLREVLRSGAVDRDRVRRHMTGFDALEPLVAPWTPERTAAVTSLEPQTLRRMVAAYCEADGAALYCSTGVNMGGAGALAYWLQEVINAVTGNLDRPGGTLVGVGITDFAKLGVKHGILMRDDRSRIGDIPSVNDAFTGGVLADEILTPGDRQVRALFVTGGNPLLTMPNAGRLREALRQLDLLVVLDIFLNETASEASYVLPTTSPLQRPDLPFIFPLLLGLQSRPYLQATRAVIPPTGEQRDEATIYLDLCAAAGTPIFGSRPAQWLLGAARRLGGGVPQQRLLDLLLRVTGQPSFARLLDHPHGFPLHPERDGTFLGRRVVTPDGKVHLAPSSLMAAARELETLFERERLSRPPFRLITKRRTTTHNSWTHNLAEFVRRDTNHLWMHPSDAARLGLARGDLADVRSATATVRMPVAFTKELLPGVVALPHGWGHQHAKGLSVASRTRGVNANLLAADGPDALDPLSGMTRLTGIPVKVGPAAGPQDASSWSGIPPSTAEPQ
ncbi:MAG: molybdopterin-dependent oxidoreductase [bacterium]